MIASAVGYEAVSRWYPHGPSFWLTRPVRAVRALGHAPVAVRFAPQEGGSVTTWSVERGASGGVRIDFDSPAQARAFMIRWRVLAECLDAIRCADPAFGFGPTQIDLGDGVGPQVGDRIVAFARLPGSQARLIPNPYLLRGRRWLSRPRPWERKRDTLYFRGSSTGASRFDENARVALCRVARTMPQADCLLSRVKQVDDAFARRLAAEHIVGIRHPLWWLDRHRYLVDADGNSSSWDRYLLIGHYGGVPIRFENLWQECWHGLLVDGENCVVADRHSLAAAVERLRANPATARTIAAAAGRTAAEQLSRPALLGRLAATLGG